MTHIGIIESGKNAEVLRNVYGDCPAMFRDYFSSEKDMKFSTFDIVDNPVPGPGQCDAWIIAGSRAGVYEPHPWIPPAMDFIRESISRDIPTLGICFGHQLMAQAMGGEVTLSEKGRGMGVFEYDLTDTGQKLIPDRKKLSLIALHQDQVVKPPPKAIVLATSNFCNFAALAYGSSGLSFQAHPELPLGYARDAVEAWHNFKPVSEQVLEAARETVRRITPQSTHILSDAQYMRSALHDFLVHPAVS